MFGQLPCFKAVYQALYLTVGTRSETDCLGTQW